MKLTFNSLLILSILFSFSSCDYGKDCACDIGINYDYLVEATLLDELTVEELDAQLTASGYGDFTAIISQDVAVYKIKYKTSDLDGNTIEASGAAILPTSPGLYSVMSYQHGTLRNKEDAPSNYKAGTEVATVGLTFASNGYIMSLPDYLGYGETAEKDHPYEHGKSLATASHDMLKAVYEFLETKEMNVSDKLYLSGYSEGGFATMALLKYIEEESDLTVTKSAMGAGAYNTTAFAEHIAVQDRNMEFLGYYLWVLDSYNEIYNLNNSWSYYLNEPYAGYMEDGATYFDTTLTRNPKLLFTETFRNDLLSGENAALKSALQDNEYHNWKPSSPIQLWHGTIDSFVPYFLSEEAFDTMTELGATVELKPVVGGEHSAGTPGAYFGGIYSYFRF